MRRSLNRLAKLPEPQANRIGGGWQTTAGPKSRSVCKEGGFGGFLREGGTPLAATPRGEGRSFCAKFAINTEHGRGPPNA
jgi:hypothetical protein